MDVLSPRSESEVCTAVLEAREARAPLEIVGHGTKRGFGRPRSSSEQILDVSHLDGVITYEPDELILTARAGTKVREVVELLAAHGQRLGFDPPQWGELLGEPGEATLGGVVSTDSCGAARVRYGAARDQLLGVRAVNGLGEAFKAGGRVVKNVTGFDIPKLVCGAFGTLCVLTELTFRVFPKPSHGAVFVVRDLTPGEGFALLRRVWSSPLEATGLSYYPPEAAPRLLGGVGKGAALIRLEGEPQPLADKCAQLGRLSPGHAFVELADGEVLFAGVGNGEALRDRPLDIFRVHIPPAEAERVTAAVPSHCWFADWAGGLIWAGLASGDEGAAERLRLAAARAHGHAVLLRAPEAMRAKFAFPPEDTARDALTRAVKSAFDPEGILNPGRMYEGV